VRKLGWGDDKSGARRTTPTCLKVGEANVTVAVTAPHRGKAFEAAGYAIDRLKEIVPIWRKEVWEGGEEWIEE